MVIFYFFYFFAPRITVSATVCLNLFYTYVVLPITLLIFIWTFNCFRFIANTTSVSHGVPCGLPALFDLLNGVDVFESASKQISRQKFKWLHILGKTGRIYTLKDIKKGQINTLFNEHYKATSKYKRTRRSVVHVVLAVTEIDVFYMFSFTKIF